MLQGRLRYIKLEDGSLWRKKLRKLDEERPAKPIRTATPSHESVHMGGNAIAM
jgi:hypothetical protein